MKEYLDSLKRNQLVKLYTKFGLDKEAKSNILRSKNDDIKQLILKESVLTKDVANSFLLGETNTDVTNTTEVVKNIQEFNEQDEYEITEEDNNPSILVSKAVTKSKQNLKELAEKMKRQAMVMLVATIQTRYDRDIEAGKKCETIYFSNQYFSVAKVVPFGVKCALPRCIVEIAQEAKAPVYHAFKTFEEERRAGRKGNYVLEPKYTVLVHGTLDEYMASEDKKRELGML